MPQSDSFGSGPRRSAEPAGGSTTSRSSSTSAGVGTAALSSMLPSEVLARDGDAVGLNVFGSNTGARGLCESGRYEVGARLMRKRVTH